MARSTTTKTLTSFVVAVGMIVILAAFAVVAAGTTGERPTPSAQAPTPAPVVTPGPVVTPSPVPSQPAPVEPGDPIGEGIVLDVADDHDVVVVVANASDTVTGARSGVAAEGMSVRWGEVIVENVDDDTLRLTWSSWLVDETITAAVAAQGDELIVTLTQKMPYPNTDAMGGDRVLEIDLAQPFDADQVRTEIVTAE